MDVIRCRCCVTRRAIDDCVDVSLLHVFSPQVHRLVQALLVAASPGVSGMCCVFTVNQSALRSTRTMRATDAFYGRVRERHFADHDHVACAIASTGAYLLWQHRRATQVLRPFCDHRRTSRHAPGEEDYLPVRIERIFCITKSTTVRVCCAFST
ncbi:uncharacterized protein LOC144099985 [Amblyomma americanum]